MNIKDFLQANGITIAEERDAFQETLWRVPEYSLKDLCKLLKTNTVFDYNLLLAITVVDCKEFFEILYHFYSTQNNKKLILKIVINRTNPKIDSISDIYSSANWHERECFDLFGVQFENHPNLKRILLPKEWEGYPLRKDYIQTDKRLGWNKR